MSDLIIDVVDFLALSAQDCLLPLQNLVYQEVQFDILSCLASFFHFLSDFGQLAQIRFMTGQGHRVHHTLNFVPMGISMALRTFALENVSTVIDAGLLAQNSDAIHQAGVVHLKAVGDFVEHVLHANSQV